MPHYYTEKQKSALRLKRIAASLRGNTIELFTASGVFSPKRVDPGSQLLAEACIIDEGWRVLDLGCGYGALGISVAKAFPKAIIVMTDVNRRAVMLAKKNIVLNHVKNISVAQSDSFEKVKGKFAAILFNPPMAAGKKVYFKMIAQSKASLIDGGLLQIVARHQKGGKSIKEELLRVFGNVKEVAKKSGYRVYVAKKI